MLTCTAAQRHTWAAAQRTLAEKFKNLNFQELDFENIDVRNLDLNNVTPSMQAHAKEFEALKYGLENWNSKGAAINALAKCPGFSDALILCSDLSKRPEFLKAVRRHEAQEAQSEGAEKK